MLIDISSFQTLPTSSTCWLMHSINMRYEHVFSNRIFFTVITNLVYIRSQTKSMISISTDKSYGVDIMTPLSCSCTLCFAGSTLTHLCISLYINKHSVCRVKKKNIFPGDRDHLPAVCVLRVRPHTSAREAWQAGKDSS